MHFKAHNSNPPRIRECHRIGQLYIGDLVEMSIDLPLYITVKNESFNAMYILFTKMYANYSTFLNYKIYLCKPISAVKSNTI